MSAEPANRNFFLASGGIVPAAKRESGYLMLIPDLFTNPVALLRSKGHLDDTLPAPPGFQLRFARGEQMCEFEVVDVTNYEVIGPCLAWKRQYSYIGYDTSPGLRTHLDKERDNRSERAGGAGYSLKFQSEAHAKFFQAAVSASRYSIRAFAPGAGLVHLVRVFDRSPSFRINDSRIDSARIGILDRAAEIAAAASKIEIAPARCVYKVG